MQNSGLKLMFGKLRQVYLYRPESSLAFRVEEAAKYLKKLTPFKVEIRANLFSSAKNSLALAKELVSSRVYDINKEIGPINPLPAEIDYEKRKILGNKVKGLIYDGQKLQEISRQLLKPKERNLFTLHIVFTDQLVASFQNSDKRYHLRVGVYGFPSIISLLGLAEALAKPKEYYLALQLGRNSLDLAKEFKNEIITEDDPRTTELIKGYILQAIFYHLEGEPFCVDRQCRLYNAHWQKEALLAQLGGKYEFCPKHTKKIKQAFPHCFLREK